jgi:O-antigen ligase
MRRVAKVPPASRPDATLLGPLESEASAGRNRLQVVSDVCLWLFAAVTLLSIAAQNVLFVGLAAWLFFQIWQKKGLPPLPRFFGWWVAFLAWTLAASLLGENRTHSLETWKRFLLFFAAWYAGNALGSRGSLRAVLSSLLYFSALWALGSSMAALSRPLGELWAGLPWAQVKAHWLQDGDWRAVSGSGGYMVLGTGAMLLLLYFGSLALQDASWRTRPFFLAMACLALGLVLTLTRSAWGGLLAGSLAVLFWKRPWWGVGLVAALGIFWLAQPSSMLVQRARLSFDRSDGSTLERIYMAKAGLGIIRTHPLLGVGDSLESFDVRGEHRQGYYLRFMPDEARADYYHGVKEQGHLHDDLLTLAALYGLPALTLALVFFFQLWRAAGAAASSGDLLASGLGLGLWAALIGWWMNGLFEYNFGSFQSGFTLWFLVGLFLAGQGAARKAAA